MSEFNQIGKDKINEIRGVTDENRVARLKYYFQESKKISEATQEIINFVKPELEKYKQFYVPELQIKSFSESTKSSSREPYFLDLFEKNNVGVSRPVFYTANLNTRFPIPVDESRVQLYLTFYRKLILAKQRLKHIMAEMYSNNSDYFNFVSKYDAGMEISINATYMGSLHGLIDDTLDTYAQVYAVLCYYSNSQVEIDYLLSNSLERHERLSTIEALAKTTNGFFGRVLFCGIIPKILDENNHISLEMRQTLNEVTQDEIRGCPVSSNGIINNLGKLFIGSYNIS
jgi:hypothetical protein